MGILEIDMPGLQHIVNDKMGGYSSIIVLPRTRVVHRVALGEIIDCDDDPGPYLHTIGMLIGYDNEAGPARDQAMLTKYIIQRIQEVKQSEALRP